MVRSTPRHPVFRKGFTLTELMVVVGITSVLVAIGVPTYLHYQCSSHYVEGKQFARALYNAEMAYYSSALSFTTISNLGVGIPIWNCGAKACTATTCDPPYQTAYYQVWHSAPGDTDCELFQTFQFGLNGFDAKHGKFRIGYYGKGDAMNGKLETLGPGCP